MDPENNDFFVGIYSPSDVRRNLLECSREMIQILKSYENIKKIREAKLKRTQQLKTVIRELDLLFSKLKAELPKNQLRALAPEKIPVSKSRTDIEPVSSIEKLERQLKDVEREIARIS